MVEEYLWIFSERLDIIIVLQHTSSVSLFFNFKGVQQMLGDQGQERSTKHGDYMQIV